MRKLTTIGICVLLALLAAALAWYAHDRRGGAMLRQAEALMGTNPDSARQVLEQYAPARHLRGEHQARYALLLTQARFKTYQPTDNDSLIRIAVDYYTHSSDSLRKAWSCFYAGQVYRDLNEPQTAVRYFHQAATAGEGKADERFLHLLYFHWGTLLQDIKPYEESVRLLNKALQYARLCHNPFYELCAWRELAWTYLYLHQYEESRNCSSQGIQLAQANTNFVKHLPPLYQVLATAYRLDKRPQEAALCLDKELAIAASDSSFDRRPCYNVKAKIYLDLQQYDSADYYNELNYRPENIYMHAGYQLLKAQIAKGRKDIGTFARHQEIYAQLLDSIHRTESDIALMELQKKYDYSRVENENIRLKAEKQSLLIAFLIPVTIALAALFACIILYRLLQKMKRWSFLQKEKTARQHEMKYANLQSLLMEYSKREIDLQESISQSKKQMEHYVRQQKYIKEKYLADCDVRPLLKQRIARMEEGKGSKASERILSADELARLLITTDALFGNFASRLQLSYGLSDTDLHLCCLLKLGVKSSHIGLLLNASNEALKKRASRLCKNKFNTDLRLEEFIASFH